LNGQGASLRADQLLLSTDEARYEPERCPMAWELGKCTLELCRAYAKTTRGVGAELPRKLWAEAALPCCVGRLQELLRLPPGGAQYEGDVPESFPEFVRLLRHVAATKPDLHINETPAKDWIDSVEARLEATRQEHPTADFLKNVCAICTQCPGEEAIMVDHPIFAGRRMCAHHLELTERGFTFDRSGDNLECSVCWHAGDLVLCDQPDQKCPWAICRNCLFLQVRNTHLLRLFILNNHFTKTGSGHTLEKLRKRGITCRTSGKSC
jgi:hypothetical protein